MITLEEAIRIRDAFVGLTDPAVGEIREVIGGWWMDFETPMMGSGGVIVDAIDGHVHALGSSGGLEDWLLAHRCGFRHRSYLWTITAFNRVDSMSRLLSRMGYSTSMISFDGDPLELEFTWLGYQHLRDIARATFCDYHFTVTSCDFPGCAHVGSRLPDFRNVA